MRAVAVAVAVTMMLSVVVACDDDSATPATSEPDTSSTDRTTTTTITTVAAQDTTTSAHVTSTTTTAATTTTVTTAPPVAVDEEFDPLPQIEVGDPELVTGVLGNGLTWYVRANDNPGGSAELRLVVDAGSAAEGDDQSAVAHFLEHMLFNGTASWPENELIDILRLSGSQFGSDVNAYTSYDETVYKLTVATRDDAVLAQAIDVLSEWLSAATLDPAEVEKERGVVLEEWRARNETSGGRVQAALQEIFLGGTEYDDRAPIGEPDAIRAMTAETLREFYDAAYRPDNAAVVVVGDVDVDEVIAMIEERFGPLRPRGDEVVEEPGVVDAPDGPEVARIVDTDLVERSVEVTLPLPAGESTIESTPAEVADQLVFEIIANRLTDDTNTGDPPFDRAYVSHNEFVRGIDAPSIVVDADPGETDEALVALLDEFERVRRFGFDGNDVQQAVAELRADVDAELAGSETRQDAEFADSYAEVFLTGEPVVTAEARHTLLTFVLDHMTPEFLNARFAHRWAESAPHVVVYGPDSEADALPTEAAIEAAVEAMPERDVTPRETIEVGDGGLMAPPEPVVEVGRRSGPVFPEMFIDATVLEFANGVTVLLNPSPVAANHVTLQAMSPGGLAAVPDADVPAARVAAEIVSASGVAELERPQLDRVLAGSTAELQPFIGLHEDALFGVAEVSDLEELFQLVHLTMTQPRVDPAPLARVLTDARNTAEDPDADQLAAATEELIRLRFGDRRFSFRLNAEEVERVDAAAVERVWSAAYGNANGWTFAVVGDIDVEAVAALAQRYVGTLPSTGADVAVAPLVPEMPGSSVSSTIQAGTGDRATLLRLYGGRVEATVTNTVLADVATEVVSARLIDRIREELGETYSPSATFQLTPSPDGGDDFLDVYIEIGVDPARIDDVAVTLSTEIDDLVRTGPTNAEVDAALAVVQERYGYVDNGTLAEVLIASDTGVGRTAEEYVEGYSTVFGIGAADVRAYLAGAIDPTRYAEVKALPR